MRWFLSSSCLKISHFPIAALWPMLSVVNCTVLRICICLTTTLSNKDILFTKGSNQVSQGDLFV